MIPCILHDRHTNRWALGSAMQWLNVWLIGKWTQPSIKVAFHKSLQTKSRQLTEEQTVDRRSDGYVIHQTRGLVDSDASRHTHEDRALEGPLPGRGLKRWTIRDIRRIPNAFLSFFIRLLLNNSNVADELKFTWAELETCESKNVQKLREREWAAATEGGKKPEE